MSGDDLWGDDSQAPTEEQNPPGMPPGSKLIAVLHGNDGDKDKTLNKYAKLAGRPETTQYASTITDRLAELGEMGNLGVPDESMGTFGLVAAKYGFHGETVKMATKFEVDEILEKTIPPGLLEVIQKATELPEALMVLCEVFFAMGYSFALDGSLSVEGKDG